MGDQRSRQTYGSVCACANSGNGSCDAAILPRRRSEVRTIVQPGSGGAQNMSLSNDEQLADDGSWIVPVSCQNGDKF